MRILRTLKYWFVQFIAFCASNFNEFLDKNGPYSAAAISFYSLFSLFPLMLALISVFGFVLGIGEFKQQLIEGPGTADSRPGRKRRHDPAGHRFTVG